VSQLARQQVLRDAFVKVTLVTGTTQGFMQFEQKFQQTIRTHRRGHGV
jgi:hypothetical protein